MIIAVDLDVKNQKEQNQKNKDTPHTRMTFNVKTGKQMHRSNCAYEQASEAFTCPQILYIYTKSLLFKVKKEVNIRN